MEKEVYSNQGSEFMAALVLLIGIVFIIVLGDWAMGKVDQFLHGCSFDRKRICRVFLQKRTMRRKRAAFDGAARAGESVSRGC